MDLGKGLVINETHKGTRINITQNSVKHGGLKFLIIKLSYKYGSIWYCATKKWVINPEMSDKSRNEWQFNY